MKITRVCETGGASRPFLPPRAPKTCSLFLSQSADIDARHQLFSFLMVRKSYRSDRPRSLEIILLLSRSEVVKLVVANSWLPSCFLESLRLLVLWVISRGPAELRNHQTACTERRKGTTAGARRLGGCQSVQMWAKLIKQADVRPDQLIAAPKR